MFLYRGRKNFFRNRLQKTWIAGWLGKRNRETKTGTFPQFGFTPNFPAMKFHGLLAHSQTQAGPLIFIAVMKPLEEAKNLGKITRFYADPVVLDPKKPFVFTFFRAHLHLGRTVFAKLQGVPYQVLEKLSQQERF